MPQTLQKTSDVRYRVAGEEGTISKEELLADPRDLVIVATPRSAPNYREDVLNNVLRVMPRDECYVTSHVRGSATRGAAGHVLHYMPRVEVGHCYDCGRVIGSDGQHCADCAGSANSWRYQNRIAAPPMALADPEMDVDGKLTWGIEIELDGRRGFDSRRFSSLFPYWQSTGDSSINTEDHGIELVGGPFQSGDRADLDALLMAVKSGKFGDFHVNRSCGLHIHIGNLSGQPTLDHSRDRVRREFPRVKRIIRLWSMLQNDIFQAVPKSRRDNRYCKPFGDEMIERMLSASDHNELATAVYRPGESYEDRSFDWDNYGLSRYDDARYYALNVHAWFYRGALEFRIPPGSLNRAKIHRWLDLCFAIVKVGKKYPQCDEYTGLVDFARRELGGEDAANFWLSRMREYGLRSYTPGGCTETIREMRGTAATVKPTRATS